MRIVKARAIHSQSGLTLAEAIIALALMCILIVPALNMLRQSTANSSHAFSAYQTDLILLGLITEAKSAAGMYSLSNIDIDFSKYVENDLNEYIVIIEEFQTGQVRIFRYPSYNILNIQPASIDKNGYFSGLITAAIKNSNTEAIKIRVMPF